MTAFDTAWGIVKEGYVETNCPKEILYLDRKYKLIHVDDEATEYDAQGEPMGVYIPKDFDDNSWTSDSDEPIYLDLHDAKHGMMLLINGMRDNLLFDPDAPPNQNTLFHSDDESKITEYERAFALGDQETMNRLNNE